MAKPKPYKWCASNHTNAITLKKLTDEAVRWPRGTYHDTWEEAHAALVARRQKELTEAERAFQRARNAFNKAKRMPPPAGVNSCPHGVEDGACKECYRADAATKENQ
jgi:hypothetical protein